MSLAGFMVVGALAAFLVVGVLIPWLQSGSPGRSQGTPAGAAGSSPSRTCSGVVAAPGQSPTSAPSASATPTTAWVNAPLGVHLRSAPTTQAAVVATLSQGTVLSVDSAVTDASGFTWYHATMGSTTGWVRSDFMVGYAVLPAGDSQGWSGMVPQGMGVKVGSSASSDVVPGPAAPLPFARIQSSSTDTPGASVPAVIRTDVATIPVSTATVQVWNYTAQEVVVRVALDPCQVLVRGRADSGWPFQTTVIVRTPARTFRFTLWSDRLNDVRVSRFLDSVALR